MEYLLSRSRSIVTTQILHIVRSTAHFWSHRSYLTYRATIESISLILIRLEDLPSSFFLSRVTTQFYTYEETGFIFGLIGTTIESIPYSRLDWTIYLLVFYYQESLLNSTHTKNMIQFCPYWSYLTSHCWKYGVIES